MLGLRLSKSAQMSNWGAYPLQEFQIRYAGNDAYAAVCIERALLELG
jgi:ribonuclease D